jgi:hypothetical protein
VLSLSFLKPSDRHVQTFCAGGRRVMLAGA